MIKIGSVVLEPVRYKQVQWTTKIHIFVRYTKWTCFFPAHLRSCASASYKFFEAELRKSFEENQRSRRLFKIFVGSFNLVRSIWFYSLYFALSTTKVTKCCWAVNFFKGPKSKFRCKTDLRQCLFKDKGAQCRSESVAPDSHRTHCKTCWYGQQQKPLTLTVRLFRSLSLICNHTFNCSWVYELDFFTC